MNTHTLTTAMVVAFVFGSVLVYVEHQRLDDLQAGGRTPLVEIPLAQRMEPDCLSGGDDRPDGTAGRPRPRSPFGLHARVTAPIDVILVREGDSVRAGEPLIRLDAAGLAIDEQLAAAEVALAEASLRRLRKARESEREQARTECEGVAAELEAAETNLARIETWFARQAATRKMLDEHLTRVTSLKAQLAAAEGRLRLLARGPDQEETEAARAALAAAQARLSRARLHRQWAVVRAPVAGRIVAINGALGELAGPDQPDPVIVLSAETGVRQACLNR